MPRIELAGISRSFGGVAAVSGLDLTIESGSFLALLGPSGCGKTTTLRMLAGLEWPDAGEIRMDGRVLVNAQTGEFVPPERRGVGLVFQSYALWPHMTVEGNVGFGLSTQHWPRERQRERVHQLLDMLHVSGLERRYPSQLSGGQQQRVALARSLATGPSVLLLDEPLSNLDAQLRIEMRAELKRLHAELGTTVVYVTHDQAEAMTMATMIAVMHEGALRQVGPPLEIYRRPADRFVASFVGNPAMNFVEVDGSTGTVARSIISAAARRGAHVEGAAVVGIRPESLVLGARDSDWTHAARVVAILPTGPEWLVRLEIGGASAFARVTEEPRTDHLADITVGAPIAAFLFFGANGLRLSGPGQTSALAGSSA